MREGANATLKTIAVTLPDTNAWVKLMDDNVNRTYVMIQNDQANHPISIGFGTNTVAPTIGFDLAGSTQAGHQDNIFQFHVAPINAVWAKVIHGQDHLIHVVYDD
tara:strand:+ start:304 stop:618 length:315 start_codon:yes stop_codon:yes gene_type:complete